MANVCQFLIYQLNTCVKEVRFSAGNDGKWEVITQAHGRDVDEYIFDAIVVCSG